MTASQARTHDVARYLVRYLSELSTKTIVVEHSYTDADYLDDFASYYVKSYAKYDRRCKRLHFFDIEFDAHRLAEEIVSESPPSKEFYDSYLGFVVARPLPEAIIGRTVLRTPTGSEGKTKFVVRPYVAHLFGMRFCVNSLAFQEQDSVLAACATVALWSTFQSTSEAFGSVTATPAEITRAATSAASMTRPLPSRWLSLDQMARAVKHVRLEPEVTQKSSAVPLLSLMFSYMQLGIPIILVVEIEGVGGHALTVVGYSLQEDSSVELEDRASAEPPIKRIGLRIKELYVHDDGVGPFSPIQVRAGPDDDEREFAVYFEGGWHDGAKPRRLTPVAVIVPVYHKIRLSFMDLQEWIDQFNSVAEFVLDNFSAAEWSIALTTTNVFKGSLRTSNLSEGTKQRVLIDQQPKYLWRACLTLGSEPLAEILFDGTAMSRSFPILDVFFYDSQFQLRFHKLLVRIDPAESAVDERFLELLLGREHGRNQEAVKN